MHASTVPPQASAQRRPLWVVAVGLLFITLATASLGAWQLRRAWGKEAMIALQDQAARQQAQKISSRSDLDALVQYGSGESRRVILTGHWAGRRILLDNRVLDGRSGVVWLEPLALSQGGVMLVNRGWLTKEAAAAIRDGEVVGEQDVQGVLTARIDRRLELSSDPAVLRQGDLWQNLDWDAADQYLAVKLPRWLVVQVEPTAPWRASPLPDAVTLDPSKHYGYAAQWFAMSALTAGFAVYRCLRGRGSAHASENGVG